MYSIYHFQIVIKIRLPERQKQKKSIKQKCMVSILPPATLAP
nr:hypothetical protein [Escherichia coli]